MPFPYRPQRLMKITFSKQFPLSRRRPRCCHSHHLLRQSTWRTPCGLSSGNFQAVFLDFLRWKCVHTEDEEYVMSGEKKRKRVPCKCIVQGVLPGSSLTLQLLHVMPYSPGKFLRAFFGQEHHCTAWSPSEVISLQPVFSSCCYFFLSQVLIP